MNIGIVNLNLNLERIYAIPDFTPGNVYRPANPVVQAGGKGVNVARVLRTLGARSAITGCLGGSLGRLIERDLRRNDLTIRPFYLSSESRVCLAIYDTFRSSQTVINEPGQELKKADAARLRRHLRRFAAGRDAMVFSGSALPGITPADYSRMAGDASGRGARVFVDVGGDFLTAALRHKPFLIKPNLEEWEGACGRRLRSEKSLKASAREALASGAQWLVISRGDKGFLAFNGGSCYDVRVPAVKAVNAVGCGDALLAGLVKAFMEERDAVDALRFAAAVASAHAMTALPGQVRMRDIRDILPKVRVRAEALW